MILLVQVSQVLAASAVFVEGAVAAVSKVVALAVVTFRDANFACAVLACLTELFVVRVVVSFSAFLAS